MTYYRFVRSVLSPSSSTLALLQALPVAVMLGGCAPPSNSGTGSGGSTGSGGTASGGTTGSGGSGSGGSTASGGSGSGGASSGGSTASGGSSSGGATGSGGVTASGGSSATGGATGGSTNGGAGGGAKGGGTGSGGSSNMSCQSGTPTPAAGGLAFPFPQHRFGTACAYATTCSDMDVATAWKNYKTKFIVDGGNGSLRVQRTTTTYPDGGKVDNNDTVSEGMAYGMIFAVFMGEKDTFDGLWKYVQGHLDGMGLMNWRIDPGGGVPNDGRNSATDADEDMGFALVMADKQWGGYASTAKDFLKKVSSACFQGDGTIKAGDNYPNAVNPSYLAPAFYRTFAKYTGDSRWMTILDKSYQILQGAQNGMTGLVPDWSSGRSGPNYGYDAARTPYRVALDACWNNEPRAITFSQNIAKFFAGVGAANIKDGYEVGTGKATGPNTNSTFVGPAGTSAMAAKQTQLLDDAYAFVRADGNKGTESYFNQSWALFSSLMMTGNFADLTQF